ncbi:hypothetical protein Tco_1416133 [Tanacetum coccineum]
MLNRLKTRFIEVHGVRYKLSMTSMPTMEHITGDQNVRDSMDMLPTWKLRKTSIQNTGLLLLQVSRSCCSLVTNIWKRSQFEDKMISFTSFEKATSKDFIAKILKICYFSLFRESRRISMWMNDISKKTPYTAYCDIQGIIYHKFSDGTLNHVRTSLNDIATGIQMEYLPKRKWSKQDKQRARVMIKAIDKKLKDRRLMRSLEKFVGGKPYRGDLRLLQRTI